MAKKSAKKAKKPVKKKLVAKKGKAKRAAKIVKPVIKKGPINVKKALSKGQLLSQISERVGLKKKEVSEVVDNLIEFLEHHLKKGGPGKFVLPGVLKCTVIRKPATKARKGINPFTGEETMFKAKPARNVVKIRPLKKLKEMVA